MVLQGGGASKRWQWSVGTKEYSAPLHRREKKGDIVVGINKNNTAVINNSNNMITCRVVIII